MLLILIVKMLTFISHNRFLMRSIVLASALATFAVVNHANSQTRQATERYTLRDDFQGESLGQWASYPPAQDIGYEPSLSPTRDHGAPGGRSLMRVIKPNREGLQRFGFIKKIRMIVAGDSRLRFSYRLNSPTSGASIEIGVAGIDGQRYTTRLPAKTNEWSVAELPLSELKAPSGLGGEAIYMIVEVPRADPDITYRFMIDDVLLSGMREARFDVRTPTTEVIEPWPAAISARSYRPGETISVEARAPGRITGVDCVLETNGRVLFTGKLHDDGTHGDSTAGDGVWSNNELYKLRSSDPAGLWLARLRGTTSDGLTINTSVRLIIRPETSGTHPRLFFSATDRQKLIERTRDPKLSALWSQLQTTAKTARSSGELAHGGKVFEMLDSEYLLPSLLAYFDVLNRARARIAYNALDAYITGSEDARAAAKTAMLDVSRWTRWEPPWFRAHGQHTYYPAGLLAADVAFGYDLLYADLSESERALIRRALIDKVIVPTFKEYVLDNRLMTNTSNWISHTVGGSLIAAAAIANDIHENESDGRFEVYVGGLIRKLEDHMTAGFLADGSYGEGISYYEFDAETLGPALVALQRAFGTDYWNSTHVLDAVTYPLYTLAHPISASPDMGDTHPPAGHGIPPFVYRSRDPVMRWFFSKFDRPTISRFIFYDDSIEPQPPTLPSSRIFDVKGNAIFRTGWSGEDIVFLYRAGPNFNHHHADQGSFLLTAFGEPLITEAGWSDYYKDPHYVTFFTQAIGHNTILVDGNPESQTIADTPQFKALNSYPRITNSITSEFYDGLISELSSVYQSDLTRYVRSIVFVKPNYFVIFDDLKTRGKPAQFDLLLHLPNRDKIKIEDLTAVYTGEKASLGVRSFPPDGTKLKVENGRVPYHVFAARTPAETPAPPAYLSFKTNSPLNEGQFLTVLAPARNGSAAYGVINQASELAGQNLKGVRVQRGNESDSVMFRSGVTTQPIRHGEWSADAATLMTTQNGTALKAFAVHDAKSLRQGSRVLLSSQPAISLAANFGTNEIEVVSNAGVATAINLFVGSKPMRVLLDGKELKINAFNFNQADQTISLSIPSGQHGLRILVR
jgi:hypothetical protein